MAPLNTHKSPIGLRKKLMNFLVFQLTLFLFTRSIPTVEGPPLDSSQDLPNLQPVIEEYSVPQPDPVAPLPDQDQDQAPSIVTTEEDLSRWDVDEAELAPDIERVDEWESIPLPPPSIEDLIRDSEELVRFGSDARQELEETLAAQVLFNTSNSVANDGFDVDGDGGNILYRSSQDQLAERIATLASNIKVDEIIIFNTDDFDDEQSEVD